MAKHNVSAGRASSSAETATALPPNGLPIDRHRRHARQRAAGQHVVGAEHMPIIIEKRLGPGGQVDGAKDHPHGARIDPLKVDCLPD